MNYVIKTAKTVDEAVSEALKELNISREDAKVEIIEEASKGFLGLIGSKDATVKVSKIEDTKDILREIFNDEPEKSQQNNEIENKDLNETEEIVEIREFNKEESSLEEVIEDSDLEKVAREFIDKVMSSLEIKYETEISIEKNLMNVNILGDEQELGIVIGKRGVTLDSIQYILSLIVNKNSKEFIRVIVDSSGYRSKREQTLNELARRMADKVVKNNRSMRLEPMNSHERKIIHEALQDYEGVITHSEGKDPYRRVIIQKERKY